MLVIGRKKDQSVYLIDTETRKVIKITVLRDGRNVGLGIDAPQSISIKREELLK